jgi:hypothetical protein
MSKRILVVEDQPDNHVVDRPLAAKTVVSIAKPKTASRPKKFRPRFASLLYRIVGVPLTGPM